MTAHSSPQASQFTEAILKSCSLAREADIPANTGQAFTVQIGLADPPSNIATVKLTASVTSSDVPAGTADSGAAPLEVAVEYVVVMEAPLDALPDADIPRLLRYVWPSMRSALGVLTGVAGLPSLAMPAAPPDVHIEPPSH